MIIYLKKKNKLHSDLTVLWTSEWPSHMGMPGNVAAFCITSYIFNNDRFTQEKSKMDVLKIDLRLNRDWEPKYG